jgi:hypothetical protein
VVRSRYGGGGELARRQRTPALGRYPEDGDVSRLGLMGLVCQLGRLGPLAYGADFG